MRNVIFFIVGVLVCADVWGMDVKNVLNTVPAAPVAIEAVGIAPTVFIAQWNAVPGANMYSLEVSTSSYFSSSVPTSKFTTSSTGYVVLDRIPSTFYYYRVQAISNTSGVTTGVSSYSNIVQVKTLVATPSAPVAIAATSQTTNSFVANWNTVSGATSYSLDVSASSTFSSTIITVSSLSTTSYTVNGLSPGNTYYYRVRAIGSGGTSGNSNVITTGTRTLAPVAMVPPSSSIAGFTASWTSPSGAASYLLDVSTRADFSSFIAGYSGKSVTAVQETISGLFRQTTLYYRVRAVNAFGLISDYSNVVLALNTSENFIADYSLQVSGVLDPTQVEGLPVASSSKRLSFFDGIGRLKQVVRTQESPNSQDVVEPHQYNELGQELVNYLPYVSGQSGWFKDDFRGISDPAYSNLSPQALFFQTASKVSLDSKPYAVKRLDGSPLDRIIEQGAFGSAWQPDDTDNYDNPLDHARKMAYSNNAQGEVMRFAMGTETALGLLKYAATDLYFPAGTLFKIKSKDENGAEVVEFKDSRGRTVLKNVRVSASSWASTYYIFDAYSNLVCVLPPEAVARLSAEYFQSNVQTAAKEAFLGRWAFRYVYDARQRLIQKQVPGAATVYMVYDNRDRLVLTQDGNQRATNQWIFTKYDAFNRPVLTGLYTAESALTQVAMQQRVNDFYGTFAAGSTPWCESYVGNVTNNMHGYTNAAFPLINDPSAYLTATYYDNYQFLSYFNQPFSYRAGELSSLQGYSNQESSANMQVLGQVTGAKVRSLTTATWFESVTYYDQKYRPIQVFSENIKGYDITTNTYDFVGKLERTKTALYAGQPVQWTNLANVVVQGETVRATGSATWVAGASSAQVLPAGIDGWIEVMVNQTATTFHFGLSDQDVDVSTSTIDFSMALSTGTLSISNFISPTSTTPATYTGSYLVGDVLRIERVNGVVYFKRNGLLLGKHATASTSSLIFDLSIYNNGVPFTRPRLSSSFSAPTSYAATSSFTKRLTYDHAGRLLNTYHQVNNETEILLSRNEYNELGQLVDKKLHSTNGADFKQSVDYRYNIRGWLTSINNGALQNDVSNDDTNDLFGMNLYYNEDAGTGNASADATQDLRQYNGNISAIRWNKFLNQGSLKGQAYNFKYDAMSRLNQATHRQTSDGTTWAAGEYDESIPSYDLNGNINQLQRKGKGNVLIDNLVYAYDSDGTSSTRGNKLFSVTDNVSDPIQKPKGFLDGSTTGSDYAYDLNGNMTVDNNKGISTAIKYNYLNLPQTIVRSNNTLDYIYDATGRKLAQVVSTGSSRKNTEYVGPWVFENGELQFLQHDEGRVVLASRKLLFRDDGTNSSLYTPTASMTVSQEIVNGETYVKVSASNGVAIDQLGVSTIGGTFLVNGGERYLLRVKGYTSSSRLAHLRVKVGSSNLVWPGAVLGTGPENEMWVESNFIIPSGATQMTLGVLYKTTLAASNDYIRINELELYKLESSSSEYQYHLKDHLGNVRLTFTAKDEQEVYTATFEDNTQSTELQNFRNYSRVTNNLMDHTDTGTLYDKSQLLNGGYNGQVGLAKNLAVMPGDKIKVDVYAKYLTSTSNNGSLSTFASALLTAFGLPSPAQGETGTAASALNSYGVFVANGGHTGLPSDPKAWLNVLVFDKDYNLVDLSYQPVKSGYSNHQLLSCELTIKEPGYVYIYLSNEGNVQQDVYFDDMTVTFTKGPIVQMEDYYPFGLAFNSYSRENSVSDDFKYNGKEEQSELSLGWLDYGVRMYQPELGRFFALDRFSDIYSSLTPYQYGANNPPLFMDVNGDSLITAFSNIQAMLAFVRQTLESLQGGGFKLTFSSTGDTNENGDFYYNVSLSGGDKDKLSEGGRKFYNGLKGVIDDDRAVKINVVYGDRSTHTGNFGLGRIDMADMEKWPKLNHSSSEQNGPTVSGKMIHEIREQFNKAGGDNYEKAHGTTRYSGSALYWEDAVNGNERLNDANGDKEVIQQFRLKNGSVVKYQILGAKGRKAQPVIIVKPYIGNRGIEK